VSRKSTHKTAAPVIRLVPPVAGDAPRVEREHPAQWARTKARTIVVASGKGGVGKSNLAANLALALGERGAKVVLLDGDLAQANLDILLGLHPRYDLQHVLLGEKTLDEIVVQGPFGVKLVPAASGVPELADLDDYRRELLLRGLGTVDADADFVIIDTASGVSKQTTEFCRAAHEVIVVTTPEMPAFSDAYALVKLLQKQGGLTRAPRMVVNMASGQDEAEDTAHRIKLVARHFLRLELDCLGTVPFDPSIPRAVRLQEPVVTAFPKSPAALAYRALAAKLWKHVPSDPPAEVITPPSLRLEA
jgi:flagellar biosynthesis protein FlhG